MAVEACSRHARQADDWNRKTGDHLSGPVEILGSPNRWGVAAPAHCMFTILDSQSDRHIVQIFQQGRNRSIYATILAIPNYRLKATDKTVITFTERPAGRAGSAPRLVLSGQKLGRGIRLSEGAGDRSRARPPTRQFCLTPAVNSCRSWLEPIEPAADAPVVAELRTPTRGLHGQADPKREIQVAEGYSAPGVARKCSAGVKTEAAPGSRGKRSRPQRRSERAR